MGDIFKHFIDLIKDKTTSWGFKTALFVSVIGIIFLTDFYLGFSYNYHLNNKIEQLDNISNLKQKYQTDSVMLAGLTKMERKVFYKKHYSDQLSHLFIKDSTKTGSSEYIEQDNPTNIKPTTITKKPIRSIYWMTFTSNYLFVIILPFLIFLPFYSKDGRKASTLAGWFASMIMFGVFGAITTWIAYQIPIFGNNPIWNYIINFLIHTLFWILIFQFNNDKKKN
ncbi:hypothetical protein [Winogradskyella sp. SM1960]|uniref:hypothetical protein n=1 Tax=Winogradskyella sp. SM1960 TaxID=2865955 RepID=UPI001CD2EDE9|nr:hypothetical protein [Winogradskyella sp. SM1960]